MIDSVAAGGFSASAAHPRLRPVYARAAIGALKGEVGRGLLLDPVAGTGILAGQLTRAGIDVIAMEHRQGARAQLVRALPEVPTLSCRPEAMAVRAGAVDTVALGDDALGDVDLPEESTRSTVAECRRVLQSSGHLAICWNRPDTSVDWVAAHDRIVTSGGGPPSDVPPRWLDVVDSDGGFELTMSGDHATARSSSPARVLELAATALADVEPYRRTAVLEQLDELIRTHPSLAGRSRFDLPYRTELRIWQLR